VFRSEFTLSCSALTLALVIGPCGGLGGLEAEVSVGHPVSGISLAFVCGEKYKCQGTSEDQGNTKSRNIKDTSIKVIPQLTVFWDKHITLRMTAMLPRRCLKLEDEDST
jgi:hypothetical protein